MCVRARVRVVTDDCSHQCQTTAIDVRQRQRTRKVGFFGALRSDKDKLQLCVQAALAPFVVSNIQRSPGTGRVHCFCFFFYISFSPLRINFIRRKSELCAQIPTCLFIRRFFTSFLFFGFSSVLSSSSTSSFSKCL